MYWKVLEFAVQQGFDVFDFGRCSQDAGTYRFKQQWGAQPLKLYWDYVLPDGEKLPALNPDNPKFRLMIAVWQRLPVMLTNLLGPHIVKRLP
jgi:lipid II:glycine glycyltransferase (peptidoglycan interpeptide bridge formation enzyme)